MADLWKLVRNDANQTVPVLIPASNPNVQSDDIARIGGISRLYTGVNTDSIIDVVNNFQWTKSPQSSRKDTPYIRLTEKRLLLNSIVSNIANSTFTALEAGSTLFGAGVRTGVQDAINAGPAGLATFLRTRPPAPQNSASESNQQGFVEKLISETEQGLNEALNSLRGSIGANEIANSLESISNNYTSFQLSNPVLTPYNFLYATEKTGFVYDLPFLSNNSLNELGNNFSGEAENILGGSIANIFTKVASGLVKSTTVLKPGTYIEKSKQYSMGDAGRSITIEFPLLNTGEFKDIVQNWQFLFGLIYQNKPGRITRAIIDLPVIYEINCPGVVYMPFGFISSLSVGFIGNRREITFNVPVGDNNAGGTTSLTTTVPDAYMVSITIQGLNEETRNFLFASVTQSRVTVPGDN